MMVVVDRVSMANYFGIVRLVGRFRRAPDGIANPIESR